MFELVMMRHGQSVWNEQNRFTGWVDVGLTERGIQEAKTAGQILKEKGYSFDKAYTSYLQRAIKTLWLALEEMDSCYLEVEKNWRLNERHYGSLQGLNKKETAAKFGEDQVKIWRRSFDTPPPLMESLMEDPRGVYKDVPESDLPKGEALKNTIDRVKPYWDEVLLPDIKAGKKLLVSAHGNSIRAIVQMLENLSQEDIMKVEIPTGVPLLYRLNADGSFHSKEFMISPEELAKKQEEVAAQGKA